MSSTPGSRPPEVRPPDAAPPARGIFVRIAILLTVLIFVGTVFVIYYRWVTVEEPTSVVVLEADEAMDGAIVTVEGVALTEPLVTVLEQRGRYRARFFLHPGSYTVRVEHEGEVVYQQPLMIEHGRRRAGWQITLTAPEDSGPEEP